MTCTDDDHCWTVCPDLTASCCIGDCSASAFQHDRVVIDELGDETHRPCDVILDSGADASVLLLHFSDLGQQCASPSTTFVDAQGCPLAVSSTPVATLHFGSVVFKEKVIVADVTMPLIAHGNIIRSGWSLIQGACPSPVSPSVALKVSFHHAGPLNPPHVPTCPLNPPHVPAPCPKFYPKGFIPPCCSPKPTPCPSPMSPLVP